MSAIIVLASFVSGLCLAAGAYRWKFGLSWRLHIFFGGLNAGMVIGVMARAAA